MASIEELVRRSGMIFTGTVLQAGTTEPVVPPGYGLAVLRVERGLRVDAGLGELCGRLVTVKTCDGELKPNRRVVIFADHWLIGVGIAVQEVAHLDADQEAEVAAEIARLPFQHLRERILAAVLVVDAEVVRVRSVEAVTFERNAARWEIAELKILVLLRGQPRDSTVVYFPTSNHPLWKGAPRFKEGQHGIFILHAPSHGRTESENALDRDALVALDPADFRPESDLETVQEIIRAPY